MRFVHRPKMLFAINHKIVLIFAQLYPTISWKPMLF